jgi:hypothetical protein
MNATTIPQLMIGRVSGKMFQTRRPEVVAVAQPTTLKNVPISNAPQNATREKCLASLAYHPMEVSPGIERRFSLVAEGGSPLGPSRRAAGINAPRQFQITY